MARDSASVEAVSLRVLLVEASAKKFEQMQFLLQEAGYPDMSWARSFSQAHNILSLEKIDIIIVAEDIGDTHGIELIWGLSSDLMAPPAMMIADTLSRIRAKEARNLGAIDYITWAELTPRFLDRTIRCVISENVTQGAIRNNADDLIQRIFELEHSYQTLEEQAGENAHLAEQLDLVRSELEGALSQVVKTKEELEVLNDEKNKLFSIIAHDLRSPLSSLLTLGEMIDLMGDTMSQEDLLDYITGMSSNVKTVHSLLENLLEWARIQMDQVAFDPCTLDLHELVERTVELLSPVGVQKSVSMQNDMPMQIQGYGDPNMVDTIIRNLANNAVKFTPEGGTVTISAESDEDMVTISIKDTGVGVPASRLETLFELDKGSTTTGTKGEKGSGLGLILCRDMVVKNGGKIWAESDIEIGSTFFFTLPVPTSPKGN